MNTCQICGREIKAKNGLIAHHGYKRPDAGWQTASCMGARHLPYEVSNDVLPIAIENVFNYIENTLKKLEDFTNNPPKTLTTKRTIHGHRSPNFGQKVEETYEMPKGFSGREKQVSYSTKNYYEFEYFRLQYAMTKDIEQSKLDLEYLKARLANWKKL